MSKTYKLLIYGISIAIPALIAGFLTAAAWSNDIISKSTRLAQTAGCIFLYVIMQAITGAAAFAIVEVLGD